jgi:hypothetical protein
MKYFISLISFLIISQKSYPATYYPIRLNYTHQKQSLSNIVRQILVKQGVPSVFILEQEIFSCENDIGNRSVLHLCINGESQLIVLRHQKDALNKLLKTFINKD